VQLAFRGLFPCHWGNAALLGMGILHLVALLSRAMEPHQAVLMEGRDFAALSF